MANSKLTRDQKNMRIEWLTALKFSGGEIATAGRFTVVKVADFPGARMAHFSASYCAKDEQKIRRKVGEYYALKKLMDLAGNWIGLPEHITAQVFADSLSEMSEFSEPWVFV